MGPGAVLRLGEDLAAWLGCKRRRRRVRPLDDVVKQRGLRIAKHHVNAAVTAVDDDSW